MQKDENDKRNEKLLDAMFKVALEENIDREMENLPSLDELNQMFPKSAATDKRFKEIINPPTYESRRQKVRRLLARIAASLAIVFAISTVVLLTVEASRNFILNTIIRIQDDHMAFEFGDTPQDESIVGQAILVFLPAGFTYLSNNQLETRSTFIYGNEIGERIIVQKHHRLSLSAAADTENREYTEQQIGNQSVYIFEATENYYMHIVMWEDGDYVFNLISSIDLDILKGIVASFIYG